MAKNILVAKNLQDYASGDEVCPATIAPATPSHGEGQRVQPLVAPPPTIEQKHQDVKDAQAMSMIALTIK